MLILSFKSFQQGAGGTVTLPGTYSVYLFLHVGGLHRTEQEGHPAPCLCIRTIITHGEDHLHRIVVVCLEQIGIDRIELVIRSQHFLAVSDTFSVFIYPYVGICIEVET